MFNYAGVGSSYRPEKVVGGFDTLDFNSHRILYAGPDPADKDKVLIRKIVQVSDSTYCYEESRISASENTHEPTVHTQLIRLKGFNLKEHVDDYELNLRGKYKPIPNLLGFSLYYRDPKEAVPHVSVIENTLNKIKADSWIEFFQDLRDKRDMSQYLKGRWFGF
ncbi:UNKNOWN [Stylonychia lemnae]|uniref:Uncharacterized protein n=1 Tax=Stylonychia lemnae TaxID=5949 RepID=A0A078ABX6_STYLE|nr:UNKNOWN [Stylonychia lemnae]|eukprot:CDW79356.1 UNKNOWN [Stylonychia lemnae]